MTKLKNIAMIAALSVTPAIAFADAPQTGSPAQSVAADPNETVGVKPVNGGSIEGTASGSPEQSIIDDPNETAFDTLKPKSSIEGTASGSPEQSVTADPNEKVEG